MVDLFVLYLFFHMIHAYLLCLIFIQDYLHATTNDASQAITMKNAFSIEEYKTLK